MSDILSVGASVKHVNSIIKKDYHTYTPYTQSFGNNDEIRITIQSQDLYVLPSESYISVEVVASFANNVVAEATFPENHVACLFSDIRYELNGVEIDRCKNPGITANMKRFTAHRKLNLHAVERMYEKTTITARTYQLTLPLSSIFGFADDYKKVIMNAKHELILVRSRNDLHSFICDTDSVRIQMTKVSWKVPHIQLSDHAKLSMLRYLERKRTIDIPYRSWDLYELPQVPQATKHIWAVKTATAMSKPRYVFVGFHTNRVDRPSTDPGMYDHCNLSDVKVFLNNDAYPYINMDSNFTQNNYEDAYIALINIQQSYYGPNSADSPFYLARDSFGSRTIFAIDCSNSDDSLLNSTVDVRIEINARTNIAANTVAYCLIIHDNVISYSPFDGIVSKSI